jgi:N4-(beta-N-acetylglucosaminyl)-L-asparaginase
MRRRDLLFSTAAGIGTAAGQAPAAGGGKNIVISSANGLQACAKAQEMIRGGGDTLEAAVTGVTIVEDDPKDNSVGYGGLPNEDCVVELDASVMHGPTRRCGAVAGVRNIKNVARLAKIVMDQTDHVMLVGQGATHFATLWGMKEMDLLTEESRLAWLVWKQGQKDAQGHNNWKEGLDAPVGKPSAELRRMFPNASDETLAWAREMAVHPTTGTINCLALNAKGEMSGTTTTSGLAWKIAGRIGDSPIIGAGLYVDQEVGAAGSTGRGEENIRVAGAHTIVENMRHGMDPKAACLDCLKRIARNFDNDKTRLAQFDINFYCLRKDGAYAGAALWNGRPRGSGGGFVSSKFAVNDGGPSRLEECVWLLERK